MLLTSQAPFYIEYVNKQWSELCGWESHEVCGLTCNFLQGVSTVKQTIAEFLKDLTDGGYGCMRIQNYKKNGNTYKLLLISFIYQDPVFIRAL